MTDPHLPQPPDGESGRPDGEPRRSGDVPGEHGARRLPSFLRGRPALIGGISAGLVVILVVVLVVVVGGGSGKKPTAQPTGVVPTPSQTVVPSSPGGVSGKPPIPVSGAYLGAYAPTRDGDGQVVSGVDGIDALEKQVGAKLLIDHRYYNWNTPFPTAVERQAIANGQIPFMAFQALYPEQVNGRKVSQRISYADIADGKYDKMLAQRADAVKALGAPVFISFQHEPGSSIGQFGQRGKSGTSAQYVAAWRHIVDVFRQQGATNAAFVWVETAYSFRKGGSGPTSPDALYPGDDYIDWIAADGYNFFGCPGKRAGWTSFSSIFNAFYQWGQAHKKPMMVAEFGVSEDPNDPGRKGEWYKQTAQQVQKFPDIKALVYFNSSPKCPNQIDSSPSALEGFKTLAQSPYWVTK